MNYSERLCLSLLQNCKSLRQIKQIQAFTCKSGLESHPLIAGKLILHSAVSIPVSLDYARRLLLFHVPEPDVFMYNSVIRGLSESENPQDSVSMFIEMRRKMFNLDSFSFAFVLKGAANLRSFLGGIQLHCQALVFGFNTHVFVGTTLVSLYGECGCVEYAHKVFDEMSQRSIVSWNAMLTACLRCGNVERGKRVFDEMPFWDLTSWNVMLAGYIRVGTVQLARELFSKMPVKDDVSWSTMISGFAQNGCFDEAFGFFRDLRLAGVNLNEVSLTGVLSACAQAGAFEFGKILHGFVEKSGFGWMVSVNNALLETYAKCGNVGMARLVFERIPGKKSIVSWTSMIGGLAMLGYGEEAIQLFHQMEESGITPDEITFISLLYACSHTGLVEKGSDYFNKMIKFYGIKPTIEHYGCMVDIYGRAGLLQRAYEFINRMPMAPTAIIWRTLLGACSIHGNIELAEEVQKRVFELDPNDSSDHILLWNVYAVAGKWKDAAIVRRSMSSQGIIKQPGWSMIEVDRNMYKFVAGGDQSEITKQASEKLSEIISRLRVEGGYFPETRVVLYDLEEEEKQVAVTMHSEKLAVAFGMMRSCEGKIIRIVKNLRICRDCHTVMKLISKVYRFEIVVRDRSRFHSIKDGSCTCRDFW